LLLRLLLFLQQSFSGKPNAQAKLRAEGMSLANPIYRLQAAWPMEPSASAC